MHPNKRLFAEGLEIILRKWSALNIALQMTSDELEKRNLLHESLLDYFSSHGPKIEPEDLEDALLEVMSSEFGVVLQDQSEQQVAKMICELYMQSSRGERNLLDTLRSISRANIQHQLVVQDDSTGDFESDESLDQ